MGVFDSLKQKKSISELEEEKEQNEAEITVLQQRVIKKELEKRGADLSAFKGTDGKPIWSRALAWIKSH